MLDNILSFLIVIAVIETLFTIFNIFESNDENVLVILDDSDIPKPSQLRTKSFYESDEYDIPYDEFIEIPFSYDTERINYCYLLLKEYSNCLNNKNEYNYENYDCKKLFEEKLNEFEKCDLIYNNISPSSSIEDKLYDIKYNINDIFENIEDDDNDKQYLKKISYYEEEIDLEEKNNKREEIFQEIDKETFIMKNDKDCVEYVLSEEDENIIKCARYE